MGHAKPAHIVHMSMKAGDMPTHWAVVEGDVARLLGELRDAIVAASPAKVD